MESYSKTEIDAKLESLDLRVDSKFERVLSEVRLGFAEVSAGFKLIDKDINWLKWLTGGTFFLLLSIGVAAALRFLF